MQSETLLLLYRFDVIDAIQTKCTLQLVLRVKQLTVSQLLHMSLQVCSR